MSDARLEAIRHELVRIMEHQSEILAVQLYKEDQERGRSSAPWHELSPGERGFYRQNARDLMAERSREV